ncbi:MAG: hypothetical protein KME49_31240 [Brasilonema octagenarum HA4186-MV1]|uniref:Uncharacterized protein n=2 Tax=Brasilonema TaxID=383614 RepID=A0A856MH74_9CYAN|nr:MULTISPECIES: hypothetical protein [Brasilonema]MBW4629866.1 hypothetical protein [Brasilonema octagenarum HA4186-MV1]NMF64328.1 hypothetical protein [Brasilonema octagenarum UFV-OR1]QDL10038.1 hypothetical protein DP114_21005 [Brasilonema sennae CENA114]QDL16391.1 hypothetical protein DP113_20930 [Brasilonema octagenarum UFV-E1]
MRNLTNFTFTDMVECGLDLCQLGLGVESMESASNRIVQYFYESLIDEETGAPACALIRCFKTHSYEDLDAELRQSVCSQLGYIPYLSMKCLTMLATIGDKPEWNSRHTSLGHKVIPLVSEDVVAQFPMISQLLKQFGLDVSMVIGSSRQLMVGSEEKKLNVFHVPVALGSPYIPAQESFVIPFGIKSVLGFGGLLPSGNLFAIIMFSKVPIPRNTAEIFKSLAPSVRSALLRFDGKAIFA